MNGTASLTLSAALIISVLMIGGGFYLLRAKKWLWAAALILVGAIIFYHDPTGHKVVSMVTGAFTGAKSGWHSG